MPRISVRPETAEPVTVDVHTRAGKTDGTVDLDGALFGAQVNVPAMHQVVVAQLAAARSATSKVKSRGEVRGGGAKPWRQKGTGRARQGSIRSPQWVGGGVAHGPSGEQNYTKRVSKSLKRVALRSALSDRASSGDIRVVSDLTFEAPKTKDGIAFLDAMELGDRRVLLVLGSRDENVAKTFRNLPSVHILTVDQLNTYDILVSDIVVFQRNALPHVGKGTRDDLEVVEKRKSVKRTRAGRPQPPPEQRKNRSNRAKTRNRRQADLAGAENAGGGRR